MSGFLNDIKGAILGGTPPTDETNKAILDIESKKRTISQASNNEQNSILEKINNEYLLIGKTAYELHEQDNFDIDKIKPSFENIKNYHELLNEKKSKLDEILNRYDEELKILRPSPPSGDGQCINCGASYVKGATLFCGSCGTKISQPEADTPSTATSKRLCKSCSKENSPEAAFCAGCGSKITE